MPERKLPPHLPGRSAQASDRPSGPERQSGYDAIYLGLIPRLAGCDFEASAGRLGLDYREGHVLARCLGRDYAITRAGVEPLDGQPANVNVRSVLLYYLLSTGSGEPESAYVLIENLPRLVGGLGNPIGRMAAPLEQKFGVDYAALGEAALSLGGAEEPSPPGSHAWRFELLPKVRARLVFQEADDEFAAAIQVLLDRAALRFLDFECLVVLAGCFVGALIQAGGTVGRPGAEGRRLPESPGRPQ